MTDSLVDDKGTDSPALDQSVNYLAELVGEGKKFKTAEELAYGKAHSDAYIKILERQLDQYKTDYVDAKNEIAARAKFEEMIDRLNQPKVANQDNPGTKPEINMAEIETLVSKKIQETELEKRQRENLDMVKAKLNERFGNNLENHLKEIGLDGPSAAQLAKNNPQLVLKALGVDSRPQEPGYSPPPRNSSGFTPKPEQKRTWAYYQDLFTKQPSLRLDNKTNVQMQKDYIALGTAFEDGDFNRFG